MPGKRLNLAEREEIMVGLARDESVRQIAGRLGRAPSAVSREARRNISLSPWRYRAFPAQIAAMCRAGAAAPGWAPRGHAPLRGMISIRQRPPEVADRAVPGQWEGDVRDAAAPQPDNRQMVGVRGGVR